MNATTTSPYTPGDPVLALLDRGGDRYWLPGTIRSVDADAARVDFAEGRARRVPLSRLRLGAVR
jgi:hypothetical protein